MRKFISSVATGASPKALFPFFTRFQPYFELISKGVYLGRSSVKAVAEKRRTELDQFLMSLFQLAPEICHCELIYTFSHPILRDQDQANVCVTKWRNKSSSIQHIRNVAYANGHVQGSVLLLSS